MRSSIGPLVDFAALHGFGILKEEYSVSHFSLLVAMLRGQYHPWCTVRGHRTQWISVFLQAEFKDTLARCCKFVYQRMHEVEVGGWICREIWFWHWLLRSKEWGMIYPAYCWTAGAMLSFFSLQQTRHINPCMLTWCVWVDCLLRRLCSLSQSCLKSCGCGAILWYVHDVVRSKEGPKSITFQPNYEAWVLPASFCGAPYVCSIGTAR